MFGYVRPAADRLTQEQTDLFRSAYCGLCRTLGRRYGLSARMILNYDLAFLAILLAGGSGFSCARHRCPVHPIRGCPCGEENPALDAAADLSVILTWWQLRDGVTDHGFFGGLKYRLAALLLRRSYRKAARLRRILTGWCRAAWENWRSWSGRIVPPLTARRIPLPGCWPVRQRRSRILSGGGCWRSCCTIWAAGYT